MQTTAEKATAQEQEEVEACFERGERKVTQERRGAAWRVQAGLADERERGLGAMEGNEAQVWARRLKGKGMSWSLQRARDMAKAPVVGAQRAAPPRLKAFKVRLESLKFVHMGVGGHPRAPGRLVLNAVEGERAVPCT